jgi:CRP-like cAMP-binding protein
MPYSALKRKLQEVREPSIEFWECFKKKLYERNYSHNDIWLNQGNKGHKIALLVEGGAMSYIKKDNQKLVNRLWLPNDFILSAGVFTHTESEHTIEFKGESHIIQFSIDAINQLRKTFDEAMFYIDYFLGMEMRAYNEHIRWLKSFTSEKRNKDSIAKYGDLYKGLFEEEKGSFIGVSKRWLSDIKKR